MNTLIIGGGGFLGKNLAQRLISEGHRVRIFERPGYDRSQFPADREVEWRFGDYSRDADISPALENIDVAYLFASTTTPKTSNENFSHDVQSNLLATTLFLEIASVRQIGKIIFPSSGGTVYGIPGETPIRETHPTNPICSYGINKLAIEKYLALYHRMKGLEYTALRISNPYGRFQLANTGQGVISTFMHKILNDEEIEIWGDGSVVRDYLHIDDLTRAFVQAANTASEHRVFNIGSGVGHDLNAILQRIEGLLGRKAKKRYLEGRLLDVPVNVLDISMAKKHLDWEPGHDLTWGLGDTASWLQTRPSKK